MGVSVSLVMRVGEVKKALGSVSKICQGGNTVVFDDDGTEGSYIENTTMGEVTPLTEQRGLYKLKMWVPKDQSHPF